MFGISDALDTQLVVLVGSLIGLAGVANAWFLVRIKRETSQVNNAVNHVDPGQLTLSQRMDVANQTMEFIQAQQVVYKKETADRFDGVEKKQLETRGIIEEVKSAQDRIVESVDKIRESVDRRYKGVDHVES